MMEPCDGGYEMDRKNQILLEEVRQNFASVVWTHKIQEKQADIYAGRYNCFETINIFLAAVTSCGIITTIFVDETIPKILTALISFGTLFMTTYLKSFNLKKMEQQHRIVANKFVVIRNQLLHIIAELHMGANLEQVDTEYKTIITKLNALYVDAPSTTNEAVKMASTALKAKDEYTYTAEEIDHFLPPTLRGEIK